MTADQQTAKPADKSADEQQLGSFTGEFRELARQQRFRRTDEQVGGDAGDEAGPAAKPTRRGKRPKTRLADAVPPAATAATPPVEHLLPLREEARSAFSRVRATGALHEMPRASDGPRALRVGDDAYSPLVELSRMADRVVESREQLAAERARAMRAERDLAAMGERMLAARALVHEAQRTAQRAADRCTFLEGRCDALQESLDQALTATLFRRWQWRRALRAGRRIPLG